VAHHGQAGGRGGLNGVAILSRQPLLDVRNELPGSEDEAQARFLAARTGDLHLIDVYVPNGQAVGSDAFFYKLDWLSRLQGYLVAHHQPSQPLVLLGDFNIAPDERDVFDPVAMKDRLHFTGHERRAEQDGEVAGERGIAGIVQALERTVDLLLGSAEIGDHERSDDAEDEGDAEPEDESPVHGTANSNRHSRRRRIPETGRAELVTDRSLRRRFGSYPSSAGSS
jgi:endonuclease/exonuclease/phosphatase family metal-dependent hydrolase